MLVDWLGRGGIAQVTDAWRKVAEGAGIETYVVGRAGGEVIIDRGVNRRWPTMVGAIDAHRRAVGVTVHAVEDLRPDVVVIQNYQIPMFETGVAKAARRVGATSIIAVHNHEPHNRFASTAAGLSTLIAGADELMVHSRYVGNMLQRRFRRTSKFVPLPIFRAITEAPPRRLSIPRTTPLLASSFGVLTRRYKGAELVRQLATERPRGWHFALAGRGAEPSSLSNVTSFDRFLVAGELRWLVEQSDVVLLPYRSASQSGAVFVAQSLGTPPIASAVGGIAEQIDHGRTGILVAPGGGPAEWISALQRIADEPDWWGCMRRNAEAAATRQDAAAAAGFLGLLS